MKIVLLDTTLDGNLIGGAHTFLVKILHSLSSSGHETHFVSKGEPSAKTAKGIDKSGAKMHLDLWGRNLLVDDATPILATWVNEQNPDVYVVSASPDIGWTVLPHLDPQIATLTIGHNDSETFYMPARHYSKFLTRAIGVSDEICRQYVSECGMPEERVEWIPYGVETSDAAPQGGEGGSLNLVYVGRLDEQQKRISDIVKIARSLSEKGIDFKFSIVGDGDEMQKVRAELGSEIASGKVILHGWVDENEVLAILRRSDVFLLTSNYEGFCIALIEAMGNGCCPVVTDIRSGNKQLVKDGENGFVVPVGDIDAFVDRISLLASGRETLLRMRQAAWETGKQYGVDRMVENYVACFERSVEDARANPRKPDPSFPLMESCRSKYPLWLRRLKAKLVIRNS